MVVSSGRHRRPDRRRRRRRRGATGGASAADLHERLLEPPPLGLLSPSLVVWSMKMRAAAREIALVAPLEVVRSSLSRHSCGSAAMALCEPYLVLHLDEGFLVGSSAQLSRWAAFFCSFSFAFFLACLAFSSSAFLCLLVPRQFLPLEQWAERSQYWPALPLSPTLVLGP